MKTEIVKETDILIVSPIGRIDSSNAQEFQNKIIPYLPDTKKVVFDFSRLEFISSAGLRVLLFVRKAMKSYDNLIIRNTKDDIYDIFDITGFSDILYFER